MVKVRIIETWETRREAIVDITDLPWGQNAITKAIESVDWGLAPVTMTDIQTAVTEWVASPSIEGYEGYSYQFIADGT